MRRFEFPDYGIKFEFSDLKNSWIFKHNQIIIVCFFKMRHEIKVARLFFAHICNSEGVKR